jgi:hypothetical protein
LKFRLITRSLKKSQKGRLRLALFLTIYNTITMTTGGKTGAGKDSGLKRKQTARKGALERRMDSLEEDVGKLRYSVAFLVECLDEFKVAMVLSMQPPKKHD